MGSSPTPCASVEDAVLSNPPAPGLLPMTEDKPPSRVLSPLPAGWVAEIFGFGVLKKLRVKQTEKATLEDYTRKKKREHQPKVDINSISFGDNSYLQNAV